MYKVMKNSRPKTIRNIITIPTNLRITSKLSLKKRLNLERSKRSLISKSLELYNEIPEDLKHLKVKVFKSKLKDYTITKVERRFVFSKNPTKAGNSYHNPLHVCLGSVQI